MSQKNKSRRVVVTGVGAVTPVGLTAKESWTNLLAGKSGAAPITYFDTTNFDTKFACQLKGYDPLNTMDRKLAQRVDPFTQYALTAADEAVKDAELNFSNLDLEKIGVIVASGIGGMKTFETQHKNFIEANGPHRISPFFIPMFIGDIAAGRISMKYGAKGPNYSTQSACASGTNAIGDAFILVERGDADIIICGGTEASITPMSMGGFNAMKALSTRNDAPEKASRPFDLNRDGFVMGEGAGILILEELNHALSRGAKIYAEIAGIGMSADAHHITDPAPGGEGACRSMKMALRDANLSPNEVDYINAHGTSTSANDKNESIAIQTVFGENAFKLSVNSTKSMTGHLLGAAGGVEGVVTAISIAEQKIHPTINYETPDPNCPLNYTPNVAISREINVAISNTFGFGGHNATILLKKFQN